MTIKTTALATAILLGLGSCSSLKKSNETVTVSKEMTADQKTSYAVGVMMARDIKKNGVDSLELNHVNAAFNHVFYGDSILLSDEEVQKLIQEFGQKIAEKRKAKEEAKVAAAKSQGEAFLAANKTKEGVKTTPSGLQYKITKPGTGAYPQATDRVEVHYEGKLVNGDIFDSSFERGKPITFGLNQVIKGWTEGVQLINEGGEIELYIPYDLGYGERGAGSGIPPYSALIFKVQLISIEKPKNDFHNHDGHDHSDPNHKH